MYLCIDIICKIIITVATVQVKSTMSVVTHNYNCFALVELPVTLASDDGIVDCSCHAVTG